MSARERLAAKQRRRLVVPIQITDPTEDYNILRGTMAALQAAEARGEDTQPGEVEGLATTAADALASVKAHYCDVALQAMEATLWEQAMARWSGGDSIDWPAALSPLLAASCVDPDLQDEAWWHEVLGQPAWSEGDRDQLKSALLRLNVTAADPIVPKG